MKNDKRKIYATLVQLGILIAVLAAYGLFRANKRTVPIAAPAPQASASTTTAASTVQLPPSKVDPDKPPALPGVPNKREASRVIKSSDSKFFVQKFLMTDRFDVVIGGDSRCLTGVSPGEMRNTLLGQRIYNFAFRGNSFTEDYLDALEARLDPKSPNPRIVLAFSVLGFAKHNSSSSGFQRAKKMKASDRVKALAVEEELTIFSPFLNTEADTLNLIITYHDDGWAPVDRPESFKYVKSFRRRYAGGRIDPARIRVVEDRIRDWTRRGIQVIAFRMPVDADVRYLEDSIFNFDEDAIGRRLEAAGAKWVDPSLDELYWPDGHHLYPQSAVVFSDRLAKEIARVEAEKKKAGG